MFSFLRTVRDRFPPTVRSILLSGQVSDEEVDPRTRAANPADYRQKNPPGYAVMDSGSNCLPVPTCRWK